MQGSRSQRGGEPAIEVELSIWPAAVAAGLALALFGVITHPVIALGGVALGLVGIGRWVQEVAA
ncbi:MAG: hypothetical protein R3C39_12840 [Dehalococcoidia bacterium]